MAPYNAWLARGGYTWKVMVECTCPNQVLVCVVEAIEGMTELGLPMDDLRDFRDEQLRESPTGRRYIELLASHADELVRLVFEHPELMQSAQRALSEVAAYVAPAEGKEETPVDPGFLEEIDSTLQRFGENASEELKGTVEGLRSDLHQFAGVTLSEALRRLDKS